MKTKRSYLIIISSFIVFTCLQTKSFCAQTYFVNLDSLPSMSHQDVPEDSIYEVSAVKMPPTFPADHPAQSQYALKMFIDCMLYGLPFGKKESGTVYVSFVVEKDGYISNAKVEQATSQRCNDELLRVLGLMPKWRPGNTGQEFVRTRMVVPVTINGK